MGSVIAIASLLVSVPALAAALWSARESAELRRIESERDARQEAVERQAQARNVAAWMCVHIGPDDRKSWFAAVANENPVPVDQATATFTSARGGLPSLTVSLVPPGRTFFELDSDEWRYGRQADELGFAPRPLTQAARFGVATLEFTDAGGNRWSRDSRGRIAEAS